MLLVTGGLHTARLRWPGPGVGQVSVACFAEQAPNELLGLRVLALAEMVAANAPRGIDEVMRRPVLVVESLPDRVVVVERHRVAHAEVSDGPAHVAEVLFKGEFRRMHADDHEPMTSGTCRTTSSRREVRAGS